MATTVSRQFVDDRLQEIEFLTADIFNTLNESKESSPGFFNQSEGEIDWDEYHKNRNVTAYLKKNVISVHSTDKDSKGLIHFASHNFNLVVNMMLGIRQSVRKGMHNKQFKITAEDFTTKYVLHDKHDVSTNDKMLYGKQKLKYEFFDFAPKIFAKIREFYDIDDDRYLKAVGPETLVG